ncbi:MAG: hypothetical protein Q9195_004291 [Heterodermia aff. obscurata]
MFGGSDSSDSGDDNLPYPKPLPRAAFLTPDFDATTFLSSLHNRHQTLEDLRAELRSRSQELVKELLDLVNSNYQDFSSLGGSLKGGDEKVEEVRLGLLGFRRDVEGLKTKVEGERTQVEALVAKRQTIRRDIQFGRMLLEIDQRLAELEKKLMLVLTTPAELGGGKDSDASSDSGGESDEEHGISLSKLQRHAQQYVYVTRLMVKIGVDHPFVSMRQGQVAKLRNTVLLDLSTALKQAHRSETANEGQLLKVLEIYKNMGEIGEAVHLLKENRRGS